FASLTAKPFGLSCCAATILVWLPVVSLGLLGFLVQRLFKLVLATRHDKLVWLCLDCNASHSDVMENLWESM
ncbi:MAG: hypothetical protein AABY26_01645, partial [Nanoarchaeota archaeon]